MAMIDYGAILRVDGKIVNHEMFMEVSDTGYKPPEKVWYPKYNDYDSVAGEYFVYAGDEDFLVCFYKSELFAVSKGEVVFSRWGNYFNSITEETFFLNNLPTITIAHLDKQMHYDDYLDLDEYDRKMIDDDRKNNRKHHIRRWQRISKRIWRTRKESWRYDYSHRFIATWEHKGRKYECIYGFGIDPNREVWDDIKYNSYDFSDNERDIIDMWFNN